MDRKHQEIKTSKREQLKKFFEKQAKDNAWVNQLIASPHTRMIGSEKIENEECADDGGPFCKCGK